MKYCNSEDMFSAPPYSFDKKKKHNLLNKALLNLTTYHYNNCLPYRNILNSINYSIENNGDYYSIPFLPVRLFKIHDLVSVDKSKIFKTMTSSGTTGQAVSKIFLDKATSLSQSKALTKILTSFLGSKRTPMIIVDTPAVLKDRNMFSARGAGILGFSIFGTKRLYAFNENMELDVEGIKDFIEKHKGERIFLFGFTFMVYKYLLRHVIDNGIKLDIPNSVLIHGGGWKNLEKEAVNSDEFRLLLSNHLGIESVHDYYGMVEQTGSIYMECEKGFLHAPVFSDIIIRRPHDFSMADKNEKGIIQTLSVLPKSYPGHSLLTEDEGVIIGEDDCSCGRLGKYFKVHGRLKNAEIRGCSDTYEAV